MTIIKAAIEWARDQAKCVEITIVDKKSYAAKTAALEEAEFLNRLADLADVAICIVSARRVIQATRGTEPYSGESQRRNEEALARYLLALDEQVEKP